MYSELKDLKTAGVIDDNCNFNRVLTREKVTRGGACISYERFEYRGRIDSEFHLRFYRNGEALFYYHNNDDLRKTKILDYYKSRMTWGVFKHFLKIDVDIEKNCLQVSVPFSMEEKMKSAYNELQDTTSGDVVIYNIQYPNGEYYKRMMFFPVNWNFR